MAKKKLKNTFSDLPFNPWAYFGILLLSTSLLSYFPLVFQAKLWVGCLGVATPLGLLLWDAWRQRQKGLPKRIFSEVGLDQTPPVWLWVLFGALLLWTRFYRSTSLPFWPIGDEGTCGLLAMGLNHEWRWEGLLGEARGGAVFSWVGAVFFRAFEPSLGSLRLLPALLSIAGVLAAYGAARSFLPKGTAFLFAWILAFCFWELTLSRFFMRSALSPFFQALSFLFLGLFLTSKQGILRTSAFLLMSLWTGLGFYTSTSWPAVWLSILVFLVLLGLFRDKTLRLWTLFFLAVTLAACIPMALSHAAPGGMSYLQSNFSGLWNPKSIFLYTQALFWDGREGFPFGPNWGGFLNPLLTSLACLGFHFILCRFPPILLGGVLAAFLLGLLPGFISNSLEPYRLNNAIPWILLSAALGLRSLVLDRPVPAARGIVAFLLISTFLLDAYNFIFRYSDIRYSTPGRQWRIQKYSQAFEILKKAGSPSSPILLFSEFSMDYDNKTLNLAAYPMDPLQNPALSRIPPSHSAVIVKSDFGPFILSRFPGTLFHPLHPDEPSERKLPMGLFLIPAGSMDGPTLEAWKNADQVCRKINFDIKFRNPKDPWEVHTQRLLEAKEVFRSDPLLLTFYWEKMAFFHYLSGAFSEAEKCYAKALEEGVPAPHLAHNYLICLRLAGKNSQADGLLDQWRGSLGAGNGK